MREMTGRLSFWSLAFWGFDRPEHRYPPAPPPQGDGRVVKVARHPDSWLYLRRDSVNVWSLGLIARYVAAGL